MVASYLVDATRSSHEIDALALERLGYRAVERRESCAAKASRRSDSTRCRRSRSRRLPASAPTCRSSLRRSSRPISTTEGLERVYRELEEPLIPVLADIERAGVRVDTRGARRPRLRMQTRARRTARRRSSRLAGEEFNINSPKQLADVLFVKLNLHGRQEDRQGRKSSRPPRTCSRSSRRRTSCRAWF